METVAGPVAILLAYIAASVFIVRTIRWYNEEHALAGRFGEAERSRVIARRAGTLIRDVESGLHLAAFVELARSAEYVSIRRLDGRWHEWKLGGGGCWRVLHQRQLHRQFIGVVTGAGGSRRGPFVVIASPSRRSRRLRLRAAIEMSAVAGPVL